MRFIIFPLILLASTLAAIPSKGADTLFPYPVPPESLESLDERTSYIVEHFWERCNLKSAFSSLGKLDATLSDYFSFMPYADADVVHASLNHLIKEVSKNPKHLLILAEMAEAKLYGDTAEIASDELYLPFAQAVADNKKIAAADKARFQYQAKVLSGSQVGMTAPDIDIETADGRTLKLSEVSRGANTLLFVNDPECEDCALARVRLAADVNINSLIDKGLLRIVSIYPAEADDNWRQEVANYNKNWTVCAAADFDQHYDMRYQPVLYYLDRKGKILSKTLLVGNLLEAFRIANEKMKGE